jgi:hypothetical protein
MYDQIDVIDHPLGKKLYQCKRCRYNTFDLDYAVKHARAHKVTVEQAQEELAPAAGEQVVESEEQPPEEKMPEAAEPPRKAPARRRRAKKEL